MGHKFDVINDIHLFFSVRNIWFYTINNINMESRV